MLKIKITDCLFKLRENTDFDSIREISSVRTVRNRKAAFQIIALSDEDSVIRTDGTLYFRQVCNCTSYRLDVKSANKVSVYPEGYIPDDAGLPAACDILLEDRFIELTANKPAALWVDVDVDGESASEEIEINTYASFMFSDEAEWSKSKVKLDVIDVTLPDGKDFKYYLDLWQHSSNLARKHEVPMFSDEHFAVLEGYVRTLADLGQKAVTVIASEIPWSGQGCIGSSEKANMFEYSMIKVTKRKNGRFVYDYTSMQRYIDLCFKYGINSEISVYGLANIWSGAAFPKPAKRYPDGIRIRYFDEATSTYKFMSKASDIDCYVRALERYFVRKKLIDIVRIAADEPADVEAFRKSVGRLHKNAPRFRFKTAINHAEFIAEFKDVISDFVPFISGVCSQYDVIRSYFGMEGKRFLWYVCCWPHYPNTFVRSELCETLFLPVLTAFMGFDGFLRWNYTVLTDDPRTSIKYANFPVGDINFVYPSRNGKPLLSVRYKAMRFASELYELICMAKEKATAEEMSEVYACVMPTSDVTTFFTPEAVLEKEKMLSVSVPDYEKLCDKLVKIIMR